MPSDDLASEFPPKFSLQRRKSHPTIDSDAYLTIRKIWPINCVENLLVAAKLTLSEHFPKISKVTLLKVTKIVSLSKVSLLKNFLSSWKTLLASSPTLSMIFKKKIQKLQF